MEATEDLFTPIHKALRSMIYALGSRLQTNDFSDRPATTALVADLEHDFAIARSAGCVLCVLHYHAEEEENVVFPPVTGVDGPLIRTLIAEHQDLTRREIALGRSAHELLGMADPTARIRAGGQLNQSANDLFAAYLVHMNREENELVPLMRRSFTNEQMAAMRGKIIGAMPPDRLFAILGWMLPALNVQELTELFLGLQKGAPPEAVKAIAQLGAAKVDPDRWKAMAAQVGL
ncbi:MAG TPA: hemerythrin domain-containing protein [Thermoplasmata archaeon]|nr:hemerythrin domain-containing protein [Thermoplasmata archaeon]